MEVVLESTYTVGYSRSYLELFQQLLEFRMNNALNTIKYASNSDRLFSWSIFDSARQALLQLSVRVLYDAQRIRVEHIIQKHYGLTPDHAVS
jgi:hypothetical protein